MVRKRDEIERKGEEKGSLLDYKQKLCEEISATERERRGRALRFSFDLLIWGRDGEEIDLDFFRSSDFQDLAIKRGEGHPLFQKLEIVTKIQRDEEETTKLWASPSRSGIYLDRYGFFFHRLPPVPYMFLMRGVG